MPRTLHCQASECVHNQEERCNANVIQIRGGDRKENHTFCDSYVENTNDFIDRAVKDTTAEPGRRLLDTEFAKEFFLKDSPRVVCFASRCVYNDHLKCTAAAVDITPQKEEQTHYPCGTFKEKT